MDPGSPGVAARADSCAPRELKAGYFFPAGFNSIVPVSLFVASRPHPRIDTVPVAGPSLAGILIFISICPVQFRCTNV